MNKVFILTLVVATASLGGCASVGSPSSASTAASGFVPYAGIGVGGSFLNANTSGLDLDQDQSYSPAAQLTLGLSLNGPLAVELRAADLGEATFESGEALGYQVADASLLYRRRVGALAGFARIGAGALFNDGDLDATQKNKGHLVVGAGAEYSLNSRLAVRAEWQGHDVDVMHSQLSVLYRFGSNNSSRPVTISRNNAATVDKSSQSASNSQSVTSDASSLNGAAKQPEPGSQTSATATTSENAVVQPIEMINSAQLLEIENTPNPGLPAAQEPVALAETQPEFPVPAVPEVAAPTSAELVVPEPETSQSTRLKPLVTVPIPEKIAPTPTKSDEDGIDDASDSCVGEANGTPVFADGCPMFGDSVSGLSFFPDTDRLTSSATAVLDEVATALNEEPDIRVTVAAHTRSSSDSNAAMFLTRRRTIAIIRYLTSKGIDAIRLRPEAYGDTQPLASAVEPSDNDRVVLTMQ